jgi:Spy/CpxP family protein refolding chaperone
MNPMSKLKIGLYLAAIFVAGFVSGVFVTFQVGRHLMPGQAQIAEHWCRDLQSKMSLTPAQVDKIRPIINDAVSQLKGRVFTDMLSNLSNCNVRIAVELTPEQKPKFAEIQQKQEGMIRSIFGGGTNDVPKAP